jgi:hypothetical protein
VSQLADVVRPIVPDRGQMHERFAVVFRVDSARATGALEVDHDRLLLRGGGAEHGLELEIPFSALVEVRIGRSPSERLNGYPTIVLERTALPAVHVAPLSPLLLHELADLLASLRDRPEGDVLVVLAPLKPGCLGHARKLLAEGPPFDPASNSLSSHEVYLGETEAVFVFRGRDVRTRINKAVRHPSVWRAGIAWQRCFAAPPQIVELANVSLDPNPAYRWIESEQQVRT